MSDVEAKRAEVRRLQKVDRVRELMSQPMSEPVPQSDTGFWDVASDAMSSVGRGALDAANYVTKTVDKYSPTGSALRAGIGATQEGGDFLPAYAKQYGEENNGVPSGKDILAKAGMSTKEFKTPIIANPFTGEHFTASPAGLAGGAAEAAVDPTMYLGVGEAKALEAGGKVAEELGAHAGTSIGNYAAERAAKAATGEKVGALRKAAKANPKSAGDFTPKIKNLRTLGRTLLSEDEAGPPVIGWGSNVRGIAEKAANKRQFYGKQIGDVGPLVDKYAPNAIQPKDLQNDVLDFARGVPNVGKARPVRARTVEEANLLGNYGLSEEELADKAPAKPIPFAEAQRIKGQYGWEPTANDALFSNQDAMNKIHGLVGNRMDQAVEHAKQGASLQDTLGWKPAPGSQDVRAMPSEEELASLNKYQPAKEKYGQYKTAADASTNQALQKLARRVVGPSSHAIGIASFLKGGNPLKAIATGVAHQVALERGSALAARTANAISKTILAAPGKFNKYLPIMQKAAQVGNPAVVAAHHELMNNDPEYRRLMELHDEP